jgi:hypothetical protein
MVADPFLGCRWAHNCPMQLLPEYVRLSKTESFYHLREFDEVFELVVVTHDFVSDLTAGFENQGRYSDKGVQEALELHSHRLGLIQPVFVFYSLFNFSLAFCQLFADIYFHSKCPFLLGGYCYSKHIIH